MGCSCLAAQALTPPSPPWIGGPLSLTPAPLPRAQHPPVPWNTGGLSARPHTLGRSVRADALNVRLWSGCPNFSDRRVREQLWLEGLNKICNFVLEQKQEMQAVG
jgi:hypothetical protein